MRLTFLRALAALLCFTATPAAAQQVRFTGYTTAEPTLIRDTLNQLVRHAAATQACTELTAVEAAVLPPDYRPADPRYRAAAEGAAEDVTYERWDAMLCGRTVAYLVGFWPSPEGGTMFQLSHPFPSGEAASPR